MSGHQRRYNPHNIDSLKRSPLNWEKLKVEEIYRGNEVYRTDSLTSPWKSGYQKTINFYKS